MTHLKYADRLMVRQKFGGKYKYFYRSTGVDSKLKDTWFPCEGIQRKKYKSKFGTFQKGWIKKPKSSKIWKFFHDKNLYREELDRFGSLEDMKISAKMGGGFWDIDENKKFLEHLESIEESIEENIMIESIKQAIREEPGLKNLSISEVLTIF